MLRVAGPLFSTVVHRDPGRATVTLRGQLDLYTVAVLRDCFAGLAPASAVVLDFAQLDFIDSAGMHAIGAAAHAQIAHGGTLAVRSPQPTARRLLDFVNFAHIDRIPA